MLLYLCNVYSALLIDSCSCNGQGMRAPCDSEARREWRLRKWKSDDAGVCYYHFFWLVRVCPFCVELSLLGIRN